MFCYSTDKLTDIFINTICILQLEENLKFNNGSRNVAQCLLECLLRVPETIGSIPNNTK